MATSQVFVSRTSDMATFPDGRSFVRAVLDAVNRAGLAAIDMGYFAARDGQPADYCRQRVRDCEIYLVVVGFRYGSLVPDEEVSYTELEFLEATITRKPRLVFLLDETTEPPADLTDTDRTAVDGFRQRLREAGLICVRFSSPEGLELAVFHALKELTGTGKRVVPQQLPRAVTHLAGRGDELAALTGLLRGRTEAGGTVTISSIGGTAGVGKTALATYWAHRVADRFPDGQLYIDLRGFSPNGSVVMPAEAVRRFLDALEVPPERIPTGLDARAALYRSQMAGRRMLVVLDNARDSAQVRPLLPATPTCLVLVTSRNQLSGLIATDAAHPINLDVLTVSGARELLTQRLGTDRVDPEPEAVAEIITRCARLPLALALVAAHAATRPGAALRVFAGELADAGQRWQTLTGDDPHTDVRAVFSWSYHALTPPAARLFRLLGSHPGPDIGAPAAASLAGLAPDTVRPVLAELTRASLLTEPTGGRFIFHDLLRDYATHLAETIDSDEQRRQATGRILDHYLHTAHTADRLLDPSRDPIRLSPPRTGVTPEQLTDHTQAMGWFTAEHHVLMAAVAHAAAAGFDTHTWQLASTPQTFLNRQGHWHDQVTIGRAAVAAAQQLADPAAQARCHRNLASAYARLDRLDDAHTHLRQALELATHAGDQTQQAHTHLNLAFLWERQGQPARALPHARQALPLYQATGDPAGQADCLNAIGWCHTLLGEHDQALTYCQQALTLLQQLNDRYGQAGTWDSLGYAHHHLAHHAQAVTSYQHAITLYRDLGDRYYEATTLTHLGDTHHANGNPQAARDTWQQATTILEDLGHPDAAQVQARIARLEPHRTTTTAESGLP